jgi:serine protease Do
VKLRWNIYNKLRGQTAATASLGHCRGLDRAFVYGISATLLLVWVLGLNAERAIGQESGQESGQDAPAESPFISVSRTVRPAVVNIRIIRMTNDQGVGTGSLQEMYRQFFPDEEGKGGRFESPATGSGFVVDASGDILTNHHVINGADEIFVRFSGEKKEYRAELRGTDPNTDLALLKIDPAGRDLPFLEFADSDAVEVGSWAIAVGNPFGNLESTLTVGVVSAKGRGDLKIAGLSPRYQDFIQTDASINFGNSGGPLVDTAGRVIGVNTAINQAGQGIGFAVPSNLAASIYGQLRDNGRVIRGYLGAVTEDVIQVVGEEVTGEPETGARILSVVPDSPADEAGLRPGDIITEFAGRSVDSRRALLFMIAGAVPGQDIDVSFVRGGQRLDGRVRPSEWKGEDESLSGPRKGDQWLGMEVDSVDSGDPRVVRLKETLGVTATTGVMVVAVEEDQPAEEAGIRPGDVIVLIAGQDILDLEDYSMVQAVNGAGREPLSMLVRTGTIENYVMVRPRAGGVEN